MTFASKIGFDLVVGIEKNITIYGTKFPLKNS